MIRNLLKLGISPVTSVIGAVLSLIILIVATRQGQFQDIAEYSLGVSISAIAAVLLGGGTSLSFITGDLKTQRAVRRLRVGFIVPGLAVVGLSLSIVFSLYFELSFIGILAGICVGICNNLSEIESGYLKREFRTITLSVVEVGSRCFGLGIIILTSSGFGMAMVAVAGARILLLAYLSRTDVSRRNLSDISIRQARKLAIKRELFSISLLYALLDRIIFLVLPVVANATTAGGIASMISGIQAMTGALGTGLHTLLGVRAGMKSSKGWMSLFEGLTLVASLIISFFLILNADFVLNIMGLGEIENARTYWTMVCLAIPFAVGSRWLQYLMLSSSNSPGALFSLSVATLILIVTLSFSVFKNDVNIASIALLTSESCGFLIGGLIVMRKRLGRQTTIKRKRHE